jgi:hypothetical protein
MHLFDGLVNVSVYSSRNGGGAKKLEDDEREKDHMIVAVLIRESFARLDGPEYDGGLTLKNRKSVFDSIRWSIELASVALITKAGVLNRTAAIDAQEVDSLGRTLKCA